MHGDTLSYAENFEDALAGLFADRKAPKEPLPAAAVRTREQSLARRAQQAFERYLELQSEQRFEEAAGELQTLRDALEQLVKQD